ncbi:FAD-dependent monooxygenase [Allorhizobium terrae]|uniref:Monooxygenase n=1 Tax=Allorhizobium terrae TaxID=1848972 RepID=A0A4S3ZU79_9HYPH|nr:FAD-dependent monooxygenase [Allorhizobium terrae]THF49229.1 monooxygenase [Allorhizobium terrae]
MSDRYETDVLVVGSGPAGALIANLLVRRGVNVLLAEKGSDIERNFRGETIAARSVLTLRELGFGPKLASHGFVELEGISFWEKGKNIMSMDYRRFPIDALPIDIPQPAMIGAFNDSSAAYPNFKLLMGYQFTSLIEEGDAIKGARLEGPDGQILEVRSRLVIAADGRFSLVRKASGLKVKITPMERDFVWFKFPRPSGWAHESQLVVKKDRHLVILPTFPDLLRIGYNLPKKGFGDARKQGIAAFRDSISDLDPRLKDLVNQHIQSWNDTSFLEIFTAEVDQWSRDGLLLIGDASHTATPILGQGVNLALQDTIYFAPVIEEALKNSTGPLPSTALEPTANVRRAHKAMVTKFQRLQEANLAQSSALGTMMRRARMRLLNLNPAKYRLMDKVMNAPHNMPMEALHGRVA